MMEEETGVGSFETEATLTFEVIEQDEELSEGSVMSCSPGSSEEELEETEVGDNTEDVKIEKFDECTEMTPEKVKMKADGTSVSNEIFSSIVKIELDEVVDDATEEDCTSGTSRESSEHANQENNDDMDTSHKDTEILIMSIPEFNCSNTSLEEYSDINEAEACKIKKEEAKSAPSRRKKIYQKRKKLDTDKNESTKLARNKQKSDRKVNKPSSEVKKRAKNKSAKKGVKGSKSNSKSRSGRRLKKETDNDFEYYGTVRSSNKSNSDKNELNGSSTEELEDETQGEGEDSESKQLATSEKTSDEEAFTCGVCTKMLIGKAYFEEHKCCSLHSRPKKRKPHKCTYEGCIREFVDQSSLKKHVDTVHLDIRNFLCEFCVARFKTISALKTHIYSYHTKREDREHFNCEECGKTFMTKIHLKLHESLHTDTKSYTCEYEGCGKTFRLKDTLAKHDKFVHRKLKPHECTICQERFSRKTYLDTHMYKHTGIKPFSCEVCGKFFSQKGNLSTHMLIHNETRAFFKCPGCPRTFTFKSNMTKHFQQRHGGEKEDSS